jgi:beta-RFAP synthase
LHFGLFRAAGSPEELDRRFGGVGLMTAAPGLSLSVHEAPTWSADGPLADRALAFAQRFAGALPDQTVPPHKVVIAAAPPEHMGLGTGTQLGLAVARALALAVGRSDLDAIALARLVGRGDRSALGIHGFAHGGFLVEAGKRQTGAIAPLVARCDFPEEWPLALIVPKRPAGMHGMDERRAFDLLETLEAEFDQTDALCRLTLLGMLPALAEQDFSVFGETLFEFNARAGEGFAAVQGGTYASAWIAEVVGYLRRHGVRGVGQSSWGPAVFVVLEDVDRATHVANQLRAHFDLEPCEVILTHANNRGAAVDLS